MSADELAQSVGGNRDFRRLWAGLTISQAGSAIGGTALPVVAVTVLHASTFGVALLAALTSVTAVLLALPIGSWVEFHAKRPLLVGADLVRFVALLSVPIAYAGHQLSYVQLCVVAGLNGFGQLLFLAASPANLVDLVSRRQLLDANGRLQASTWLSLSVGPSVAGVIITIASAVGTVLVDAVSYLASAAAVLLIGKPESPPPVRPATGSRVELLSGARYLFGRPELRRMLLSWVLYAGCMGLSTPLTSVLYLRVLRFTPLQYGLILGVPSLAGFVGARLTRRVVSRFGPLPTIRRAAALRVPGLLLIPLAGRGWPGVLTCAAGFAAVLLFSSLSNAALTGYRQLQTPDELLARTATFWSFAQSAGQPIFIVAGGALAAVIGVRAGLFLAAAGVVLSVLVLPREHPDRFRR